MKRHLFIVFITLLFSVILLTQHAAARPAPEVGARHPGDRIAAGRIHK